MSQIDTVFQSIPAPLLKDWGQTITYIKTSTPRTYDPTTGAPLTEMVEVGTEGTVTTWSWVPTDREGQVLPAPYALALVQLDGADTAMLHVVDVSSTDQISTGDRVKIRWADERQGLLTDIACFEPAGGAA